MNSNVTRCFPFFSALLLAGWTTLPIRAEPLSGARLFARHVQPLLQAKCWSCHGADRQELRGDLDLTSREAMLRGGETSDRVLVPGAAMDSLLYAAVTWSDPSYEMPPKENDRLTPKQTEYLRDWINAGAPWPGDDELAALIADADQDGIQMTTSGGLSDDWTRRRYRAEDLWAYQPLVKPTVPEVHGTHSINPIDAFIERQLAEVHLTPGPLADRRTLLRRLTFDLIGLPPTPQEISNFVDDPSDDETALAHVVERLLASPHYGEQWGRHWLDVVRYADSSGFANDYERGNAWRYRDYVIRALNRDKPYDQFVREQVAGDELDPENPELLIATGFLRMGPWELTGMEVAKVARQRFLDDVTDSIGQVLLSHPLQCAKCHDHKFDPIPTRDYYRLQAVFATTQLAERPAAFLPEENQQGFDERKYLLQRQAAFNRTLAQLNQKSIDAARQWYAEQGQDSQAFEQLVAEKDQQRSARQYEQIRTKLRQQGVPEEQIPPRHAGFSPTDYGWERIARKGIERLAWELERYEPFALAVYSGLTPSLRSVNAPLRVPADHLTKGELERSAILFGGDPFSPTIEVTPGVLSVVSTDGWNSSGSDDQLESEFHVPTTITGRRQALALWLTDPRNPLTSRAIVNRIWQWHFGQALAGNPNNFGAMGKKPTHPELLDWLAATFVEDGWSFKGLHRRIVMSRTYRRSANYPNHEELTRLDPHGTSYARFPVRRLTAEELRDSMLAVSGELNPQLGGIPARPEMNSEAALQPRMVMGTFASAWQPSPLPEQRHRRSIYVHKLRGLPDPFMEVFNEPSPEFSCEEREASTVTPQVFSLFNSQFSYDRSLAFAARLVREQQTSTEIIEHAFALILNRTPDATELATSLEHWEAMTSRHEKLQIPRKEFPREIVREAVEENTGEKFLFTEPLPVYADFVPDLHAADVDARTRGLAEFCLILFNTNEFVYVY